MISDMAEEPWPPLGERLYAGAVFPVVLLGTAAYYFLITVLESPLLLLTDFKTFRHNAFAKLWLASGKQMSEQLQGNTEELIASASGIVLDLGPGSGMLLNRFTPDKIGMAYGVEPAVDMHEELAENAVKAGLSGKYEIISAGAESDTLVPALAKAGLLKNPGEGVFDTIMCTRVLCCVPKEKETVRNLFRLLKPGGRMIVSEHVVSPWPAQGEFLGYFFQTVWWAAGWNFWMGGCEINRDTLSALKEAGGKDGWAKIDLQTFSPWHPVPFVVGTLVKS